MPIEGGCVKTNISMRCLAKNSTVIPAKAGIHEAVNILYYNDINAHRFQPSLE